MTTDIPIPAINNLPCEYLAIRWWHEATGSTHQWIESLQQKASETNQSLHVIYQEHSRGHKWISLDALKKPLQEKYGYYLRNNPLALSVQQKHGYQSDGVL